MLETVTFTPNLHYALISNWWKAHNWPAIPLDHLPTGFVVTYNNTPAIAGFVYKTDSAFGLFEFVVANPEIKGLARELAFKQLTDSVVQYSKTRGIKTLFTSVNNKGLIEKLKSSGFIQTDVNMTNFVRRIE